MATPARLSGPCWKTSFSFIQKSITKRSFFVSAISSSRKPCYRPLTKSRSLQTYPASKATFSESPAAKGYTASLASSEIKNRVDVKKVLVIGSGGLSIGYGCSTVIFMSDLSASFTDKLESLIILAHKRSKPWRRNLFTASWSIQISQQFRPTTN